MNYSKRYTGENLSEKTFKYDELMSKDFPPNKWAVDYLIPAEGITVLSALPGSYKTWVLVHIAMCISKGEKVFGEFESQQGSVLMIDEENGARLIQERTNDLGGGESLPISFLFNEGFTINETSVDNLIKFCIESDVSVITIDSLIRVHGSNENDAAEMSMVFQLLKRITTAGITLIITHHNRKPGANSYSGSGEMRGSSDILAALDCHLALKRDGKRLKLSQTKVRFCEEMKPIEIEVGTGVEGVSLRYSGPATNTSKSDIIRINVVNCLNRKESMTQTEILDYFKKIELKASVNTLRAVLDKMKEEGLLISEPGAGNSIMFKLNN